MLFVERSNRTERLLEGLSERLMAPGRDPLATGVVVVQGPGMERWIAQSIALDYGIFANTSFPFPRDFVERVFRAIPDAAWPTSNSVWDVHNLTWQIAKRLEENRGDPDFAPLAGHLDATDGDWRLVQLAHRVANLLDQYITFRPDWVSAWTNASTLPEGRDTRWQARLLREVHAENGGGHVADRAMEFQRCVASATRNELERRLQLEFPNAIEIFAVSALPPLYLSVINELARIRDVHLSVLSPSRHYWADLWREARDSSVDGAGALFDTAMTTPAARLLVGLGRLGSDFQRNLEEYPEIQDGDLDLFDSPSGSVDSPSLLARLQTRLLDLEESAEDAAAGAGRIVSREDDSIRIHVCHGPRRELEVVEAILREAFERDESLTPEDVIVMAPKIDDVAPDIEAVFGVSADEPQGIPFRIADRGVLRRSPVAEAFCSLLDLLGGRAARGEVLEWLAREPVRARFDLDESGVERLTEWAERAGVRFGLNEDHRAALGLEPQRAHTWRDGLDRLALAHAVGASDEIFAGLCAVPLDPLGDPASLGALGDVESILSEAMGGIQSPRSVVAWCTWLRTMLERAISQTPGNAHEHSAIRSLLVDLSKAADSSNFVRPIPFDAIRERVVDAVESMSAPQPFLSGGVTFCELVPLRAIPFRIIVILGMSDDAFPRGGPSPGFDLMTQSPRPGDRTTRNDDRYLFLEALLSARDKLVLTLPGFDLRDGDRQPHSVVISDLVETLDDLFELEPDLGLHGETDTGVALRDWLVVSHPLQASSPRYFEVPGDSRLLGRNSEAFAGALARRTTEVAGGGQVRRFLKTVASEHDPAAAPGERIQTLDLEQLIERVLRSTRVYARDVLQLRLPRPEAAVGDLDPIELDPLEQYGLGSALLDYRRQGGTSEQGLRRLIANALAPSGIPGRVAIQALGAEVEEIARIGRTRCAGDRLDDLSFELDISGIPGWGERQLVGRLDQLWPDGRIELGFAKIGRRADIQLWIRHLVLCALVDCDLDVTARSVFVGRAESMKPDERVVVFERVAEPLVHLARLCEWASNEIEAPLPFFPKSSWEFASRAIKGNLEQARRAAYQRFEGGDGADFIRPESREELEYARLWEGWSPLDSAAETPTRHFFEDLSREFFEPLIAAREVHRE